MNKKIVCLVLALAMILTVGLALAADKVSLSSHEHDIPWTEWRNDIGKYCVVIKPATCTENGIVRWYCKGLVDGGWDYEEIEKASTTGKPEYQDVDVPKMTDGIKTHLDEIAKIAKFNGKVPASISAEDLVAVHRVLTGKSGTDYKFVNPKGDANTTDPKYYSCDAKNASGQYLWIKCTYATSAPLTVGTSFSSQATVKLSNGKEVQGWWGRIRGSNGDSVLGFWAVCDGHKIPITKPHTHSAKAAVPHYRQPEGTDFQCGDPDAYVEDYCEECGITLGTQQVSAQAHVFDEANPTVVRPGSCTVTSILAYKCLFCGYTEQREGKIDTSVHLHWSEWVDDPANTATCTEPGLRSKMCMDCHNAQVDEIVKALGHDFKTPAPLCIKQEVKCSRCDEKETFDADPNAHPKDTLIPLPAKYVAPTCQTEGQYAFHCPVCCPYNTADHFVTVDDEKVCKITAGKAKVDKDTPANFTRDIDKVDHEKAAEPWLDTATCTEDGYKYYLCKWWDKTNVMNMKDHLAADVVKNHPGYTLNAALDTLESHWAEGAFFREVSPAKGHIVDKWEVRYEPTATTPGYLIGWCVRPGCGEPVEKIYTDKSEVCAYGKHAPFNEDEDVYLPGKAATCTEPGYKDSYICSFCGHAADLADRVDQVIIPALGHDFSLNNNYAEIVDPVKAPTCTEPGHTLKVKCSRCDATSGGEEIAVIPHTPVTVAEKAANCGTAGVKAHAKCSVCGLEYVNDKGVALTEEEIAALAIPATGKHEWKVTAEAKDATCTETGLTEAKECTVCGEKVEATVVAAKGHTLTAVARKDATCTEDGINAHSVCSVCGRKFVGSIDVTDSPDLVIKAGHKLTDVAEVAATCTTDGTKAHQTCTVCEKNFIDGKEVTAADLAIKAAHKPVAKEAVDATCGKAGVKAHYECSVCGEYVTEAGVLLTADEKAELVIKATGDHKYEVTTEAKLPTCTEAGYTSATKCSVCGDVKDADVVPALGHKTEKVEAKAATCTTAGAKAYEICTVCLKTFIDDEEVDAEDLVVAALGHDFTEEVAAVPATHLKKGTTAGLQCSRCDVTKGIEEVDYLKGLFKDADGKVNYYADGKINTTFAGMCDFEGGKFYVKNGAVDTTLMGVSDVAYETEGVFYYFDHGQVQLQHTGMAMYDGEWFKLKEGKVDLDYEGTYTYDGSIFWVSVGRICKELNGVHPEADGVYYYVAGERNPATGIVPYMGSTFYFENGKMVNATMEYKDFNGNAWNIVNGQAYSLF